MITHARAKARLESEATMTEFPESESYAICRMCGKPIHYVGPYWMHEGVLQPRHPALPIDPAGTQGASATQTETTEQVDWQAMWEEEHKRREAAEQVGRDMLKAIYPLDLTFETYVEPVQWAEMVAEKYRAARARLAELEYQKKFDDALIAQQHVDAMAYRDQRDAALKDADSWKREWKMYRDAWLRELVKVLPKTHEIDALVLTTRLYRQFYQRLKEIDDERQRQDAKWGEQNHHPFLWLAVLGEEVGEANQAALQATFGGKVWADYRKELIETAAVAIAMVECLDRHGGKPPAAARGGGSGIAKQEN